MQCSDKLGLGVCIVRAFEQAKRIAKKHKKAYGIYRCPQCKQYHMSAQMNGKEHHVPYEAVVGEIVRPIADCCASCKHCLEDNGLGFSEYHCNEDKTAFPDADKDPFDVWETLHAVSPFNICDKYVRFES